MILRPFRVGIIPLREIIGNYNIAIPINAIFCIIPLREIIGNYNDSGGHQRVQSDYTLERDNRELQPLPSGDRAYNDYTLERDNRELQLRFPSWVCTCDYTLERDNRELQPLRL